MGVDKATLTPQELADLTKENLEMADWRSGWFNEWTSPGQQYTPSTTVDERLKLWENLRESAASPFYRDPLTLDPSTGKMLTEAQIGLAGNIGQTPATSRAYLQWLAKNPVEPSHERVWNPNPQVGGGTASFRPLTEAEMAARTPPSRPRFEGKSTADMLDELYG